VTGARRTCRSIGAAVGLVLFASGGTALAGASRQEAHFTLSSHRPDHGTSAHLVVDYRNPDDPDGKPPAVRRVATMLPRHARYDPGVPASCTATDAELMAQGAAACPDASAIGGGVVTVDTGVPGPGRIVTADVEFFNNATDRHGEFIFLNTVRATDARTVIRANIKQRRKVITPAAMLPGTPPDGGAIDTVDVTIEAVHSPSGGYVTTPQHCPAQGFWRTGVRFKYADDVIQTVPDSTRCGG
jgi:hypothetical protein